ncbi:protein FAM35A [Python bivittatus]|uniref:Protein FAM35A n=1 Tax=Python bivittatus TaxID=176946 RepID=A0A9F2R6H0_PYTBI|nr:protein FAM35A [Python bivittatus]XP_025028648.1 protein FAM35A [Python bivittatus]
MSRTPQIHMFFGAPILPAAPRNTKEDKSSLATEEPWRELYLSFTNDTFNLCSANCRTLDHQTADDAVLLADSKDHFPANFGKKCSLVDAFITGCATSVGSVKSFSNKNKVLGESPDSSCIVYDDRGNQKKHLVCQQSKTIYTEGNASCRIHNHLGTFPLVSKKKGLKKCVVENHNPSYFQCESHLLLSQYLKTCSQKTDESKTESLLDTHSTLDLSTDSEFLSILTLSQVALFSGQYAVGQNEMQNKPIAVEGEELAIPCREDEADAEPLVKLNEDGDMAAKKADINSKPNSVNSVELFDSDNSSQDNSYFKETSFQENTCVSIGPLYSPVKLDKEGHHLKPRQKRLLCSQEDHCAERTHASEDNVTTSHVTFGDQQQSKRTKLVCSPVCPVQKTEKMRIPRIKKAQKQLSLLKRCVDKGQKYSILVIVLHPCHIKEIKLGTTTSSKVPLATVVVSDQSAMQRKVVLWRAAAFLSLTVFPGDIVLFTDVIVYQNHWIGEMMLQSTFTTRLLNLGSCSTINQKEVSHLVDSNILQDLLTYVSAKHAPLQALPQRQRQSLDHVPHVLLSQLKPDTLVHAVLKIVNITVLIESMYSFKGEKQRKIILTVEQIKDQPYALVIWGDAAAQCLQLQRKKDHIWEFRYLFVKHSPVSGDLELHTTPWSVLECLFDDDRRALAFKEKFERNVEELMKMSTLAAHLEEKCSGIIQVKASISKLNFMNASLSCGQRVFDADTSLQHIFASLPLITYMGCAKCGHELQADDNEIYKQCLTCLPFNKVKIFYRPAVMTVEDGGYEISIQVGSELMERIFLNIPAEWLKKIIEPSSDTTYGMIVADLCHSLITDPKATYVLTIRSRFVLDENSFPLEKDFQLLSFHLDLGSSHF